MLPHSISLAVSSGISIRAHNYECFVVLQLSHLRDGYSILCVKAEQQNSKIFIIAFNNQHYANWFYIKIIKKITYVYLNLPFPWFLFSEFVIVAFCTLPVKFVGGYKIESSSIESKVLMNKNLFPNRVIFFFWNFQIWIVFKIMKWIFRWFSYDLSTWSESN